MNSPYSNWSQETADLVTFTEEIILNGKLHFSCSVRPFC